MSFLFCSSTATFSVAALFIPAFFSDLTIFLLFSMSIKVSQMFMLATVRNQRYIVESYIWTPWKWVFGNHLFVKSYWFLILSITDHFPWHHGTYHAQPSQGTEQEKMDYSLNNKRRVIRLVLQWAALYGDLLQEDEAAMAFLEVGGVLESIYLAR